MPETVAKYIAAAPAAQRRALKQMRAAIRRAVPAVTERISYGIPTFDLDGKYMLYIASFREHVSLYPITKGMDAKYKKAIDRYRHGRGTMRFALDEPLPIALIEKLARVRRKEMLATTR